MDWFLSQPQHCQKGLWWEEQTLQVDPLDCDPWEQSEQSGRLRRVQCRDRGQEELCTPMASLCLQLPASVVAGRRILAAEGWGCWAQWFSTIATVTITALSEIVHLRRMLHLPSKEVKGI